MSTRTDPVASLELDAAAVYNAITAERYRRELTLIEMAAELGVDHSTVACWRRGGGMSGDVALRIAVWLPADMRDFAVRKPSADLAPAASDAA